MRYDGKITHWDDIKGFGFVTPADGGKDLFLHINDFRYRDRRPQLNEDLSFRLWEDKKGRPCAVDAVLDGQHQTLKKRTLSVLPALVFLTLVGILTTSSYIPDSIFFYYLSISIITFITYSFDKTAAQAGEWRTRDITMHLLALFGGWPGALLAQGKLHHKVNNKRFAWVFSIATMINIGLFIALLIVFN